MPWQAHEDGTGRWYICNPAFAAVTATGLTEIQAGRMVAMLNETSGEGLLPPAHPVAEYWDLENPDRR